MLKSIAPDIAMIALFTVAAAIAVGLRYALFV